jgi:predicted ATP-grasp superfamily ATP-dependent carboligase/CelD/BcsL family acetyltransferase involved in cellulose biosynthesis
MKVLVTDGHNRAALAVTRSLGRAGHEVTVAAPHLSALAHSSKYCADRATYPDPVHDPDGFLEAIVSLVRDRGITCVMPISDITTFLVTGSRDRFEPHCAVPFADAAIIARAADKLDLISTASRIGVPVPQSVVVKSPDAIPSHGIEFPLVIKPWRSRIRTSHGWSSTSVSHAANQDELRRDLSERQPHDFPVMLQERIEGPGVGVFACYDRGRPVAVFSHRRLREKPPWGGVSVLCESVELPQTIRDYATAILDAIHWQGVAMVEFKMDRRDGRPKLMEINGRFWGSLQLAIDSGVDFPLILLQTVDAGQLRTPPSYRVGVRNRWLWGDVDSLMQVMLRKGPSDLRVSRLDAVKQFFRPVQDLHYDNPKWDDPWPFALETGERLRALLPRRPVESRSLSRSAPKIVTPPESRPEGLGRRVVNQLQQAAADEHVWNSLAANSQTNTIFQTHQWIRSWLETYGTLHEPFFLVVGDASAPVAVAPLMMGVAARRPARVLRFIGSGRSDYCDFLACASRSDALPSLVDALLENPSWDSLDLTNLPAASPTIEALRKGCKARDLIFTAREEYSCPSLLIDGHQTDALKVLQKPSLRRCLKRFDKAGHHVVRHTGSSSEIEPQLSDFFAQHIARWHGSNGGSLFLDERNRQFYRTLTRSLDGTGWLLFSTVELNGKPAAFHFGFDHGGSVTWYKPSFEPALAALSPGNIMVRHLISYAIDHQRRELDFTVGAEPFKQRFTNLTRKTMHVRVYRSALSQLLIQTRQAAQVASRTVLGSGH